MSRTCQVVPLVVMVIAVSVEATSAALHLPAVFTDHMVLQCGRDVPIWGWAEPGTQVTVTFGDQQRRTTAARPDGRWLVRLEPMEPSFEPRELRVSAQETHVVRDVLVGEVWLASGQSNMYWPVRRSQDPREVAENADHSAIRLLQVEWAAANEPREDITGAWAVCTPASVEEFSAVAYHFGRHLQQELNVPIGLIHASVRGTVAEAWISREALKRVGSASPVLDEWDGRAARLNLDQYPDLHDNVYDYFQQMEAFFRDYMARWEAMRDEGVDDPRSQMPPAYIEQHKDNIRLQRLIRHHMPASFYNAMIHPLAPYGMRGVIWYQGESNAPRGNYLTLLTTLIQDWRGLWGQGDFPFLVVGLANYHEPPKKPGDSAWARVREAQFQAQHRLPAVGFANTIDLGEADNVHPKNKQAVGKRLMRVALAKAYDRSVVHSGPVFESLERTSQGLVIHFEHADGGLKTDDGGPVKGFAVADADRQWHWAEAEIQGERVLVRWDAVQEIVAVRYGWADNPPTNLYSQAMLPAVPFRTDDWPRGE